MYRCIVFADSHGDARYMDAVIERMGKVDLILHLGDIYRDVVHLKTQYPDIPVDFVMGNNDLGHAGEYHKCIDIQGHTVFLTHGHLFRTTVDLAQRAKSLGAEMALFGHTHRPYREAIDGVEVINFGSISRPREGNRSCGIIEVENGRLAAMTFDYI